MDLNRKVEFVKSGIDSITQHDDEDLAVRKAAIALVIAHAQDQITKAEDRVNARAAEVFNTTKAEA